jgi:hypothetical protein
VPLGNTLLQLFFVVYGLLLLLLLLKLHTDEVFDQYSSPNIIRVIKSRRMRWAGHASCMRRRGEYIVLVWKPEAKKPLGRPRRRWEDNIKMGRLGSGRGGDMDWIDLAEDRDRWRAVVNAVMDLRVP